MSIRGDHEIEHGKKLAAAGPEEVWGWGTTAGRRRAARRGKMIARGAGLAPGQRVLEVGCGSGLFTELLAHSGAQILAVDISADLLSYARRRGLPPEQISFHEKRFEDCDLDGPFDAVVGSSVMHHLDVLPSLEKIYHLLKPGGHMCFTEPNMLNPQIALQKNVPWIKARVNDSPDETAFVRWSLAAQMKKIGFEDIAITPFDWLHPSTPPGLIETVAQFGAMLERIPLMREFAGSLYIRASRPFSQAD